MASIYYNLFITFFKIGLFSFGGGYAILPLIQTEVVFSHQWLSNEELVNIMALSQITPGPIAVNAATYVGYKIANLWGAVVATTGVALPSFLIMLAISILLAKLKSNTIIMSVFDNLKPVTIALLGTAVYLLFPDSITDLKGFIIFLIGLFIVFLKKIDPIFLILGGGLLGIIFYH